jgi:hypothetical protein
MEGRFADEPFGSNASGEFTEVYLSGSMEVSELLTKESQAFKRRV